MRNVIRRVILAPYRHGPRFTLTLTDTGRTDWRGQPFLAYRLVQSVPHATVRFELKRRRGRVIFDGADFAPSPMHAIDSDECVAALLSFLTLRPGDTDADYFDAYGPVQWEFVDEHADAVAAEAMRRFGGDA